MSARALLLAGIAALLPGSLAAQQAHVAPPSGKQFAPPQSPLVLSRTIWRSLPDGKHIMVRRRYAVRFSADGDGYVVDGNLIDATVEAPPRVEMLAELERRRPDTALFPMRLDRDGLIKGEAGPRAELPGRADAAHGSERILANSELAAAARKQASATLAQVLAAANAGAAWPADLFNPRRVRHHETRRIPLPGGTEGEIDVSINVAGNVADSDGTALPQQFERTVTTTLDGSQRITRELWTIDAH